MRHSGLMLLVALTAAALSGLFAYSARDARTAAAAWEAEVVASLALADSLERVAAAALAAEAQLIDDLAHLRAELDEAGRRIRERAVVVRAVEVPDTCAPFVAERDQLIDELIEEVEGWKLALAIQEAANAELRVAHDAVAESNARLRELLEARPTERSRWLPRVGAGAFAGATFEGRPAMGLGLTLSWEVF